MNDLISSDDILNKDLLELVGGSSLSAEEKDELYAQMIRTVNYRVIARIEEKLKTDENIADWQKIIMSEDNEKIQDFYKQHNIDVKAIAADEALKYKVEVVSYITIAEKTGKTLDEIYRKLDSSSDTNKEKNA